MTTEYIMSELQAYYDVLINYGYEVVGVFLFGSQNYNCDIETSDIDVKAVVIPTPEQMITGNIKISKSLIRTTGELTVFDIYSFIKSLKKQNINFLETLFTPYYILNPKYESIYTQLISARECIARLNEWAGVHCIQGCILNKQKKVFHSVPSNEKSIEKYGFDNKAVADMIRLLEFLENYLQGKSYVNCLNCSQANFIREIKEHPKMSLKEAERTVDQISKSMKQLVIDYETSNEEYIEQPLITLLDSTVYECCRKYLKEVL